MDILYVSAFKNIGRHLWTLPCRMDVNHYIHHLPALIDTCPSLVIFTDDINITTSKSIKLHSYDIETTFFPLCYEKELRIMKTPEYIEKTKFRRNHPEHCIPEYNIVNHNKVHFLKRAKELYPGYGFYAWVDIHYARHNDLDIPSYACHLPRDQITICSTWLPFQMNQKRTPEDIMLLSEDHIQGSVYFVPSQIVDTLYTEYAYQLNYNYAMNVADDDQGIHLGIYNRKPGLYNIIYAPRFGLAFSRIHDTHEYYKKIEDKRFISLLMNMDPNDFSQDNLRPVNNLKFQERVKNISKILYTGTLDSALDMLYLAACLFYNPVLVIDFECPSPMFDKLGQLFPFRVGKFLNLGPLKDSYDVVFKERVDLEALINLGQQNRDEQAFKAAFAENFDHFVNLQHIMSGNLHEWKGIGSYLISDQSLTYEPAMLKKQIMLYEHSKDKTHAFEIGVHGGHSLLIMLIANPNLQIDCIDICYWSHTERCVAYLNSHFNNRITLTKGNSIEVMKRDYLKPPSKKYDLIHIDGDHSPIVIRQEYEMIKPWLSEDCKIIFDDFDTPGLVNTLKSLDLRIVEVPDCPWNNCRCERGGFMEKDDPIEKAYTAISLGQRTELCDIMTKEKSDKGNGWHNYTVVYDHLFRNMRDKPVKLFEVGLGSCNPLIPSNMGIHGRPGASLYGWCQYFHHEESMCWGADIDTEIKITTPKIRTFWVDQLNTDSIKKLWEIPEISCHKFDIMIDDGLHKFIANKNLLENSIHMLNPGGFYIVENIQTSELSSFSLYTELLRQYFDVRLISVPNPQNTVDNNVLILKLPNKPPMDQ